MKLTGKRIAMLVGPGYEDLEFWVPLMRVQEEGAEVTVVRQASLGDPVEYRVKGTNISMRRADASTIMVEDLGHG